MSTAVERIEAYLEQFATLRGIDQSLIHNANGVELATADLRKVLQLARYGEPGPDSYSLRDRDGDWWVYVHDYMSWLPLGQGLSSHTGILGLEEGAAKIIARHGVWA